MINKLVDLVKAFFSGGKPLATELIEIIEEEQKLEQEVPVVEAPVKKPRKPRTPKSK